MTKSPMADYMQLSRKMKILLLCFFSILVLLIIQVLANVRDINDGWILDGIFLYFILLTLAYSAVVSFSPSLKLVAIITAIYLVAINLIPNLKYVFIYGYHDPLLHYGSIRDTTILGHASGIGPYATQYEGTPGMHILVSSLSTVTGMNTIIAMKTFLTAAPFVIPLAMYLVMKRASFPLALAKATLASVAIMSPVTYTYFGASAIYFVYVLFLYLFLLLASSKRISRSELAVAILLGAAVFISHDVTSFFLLVCLLSLLGVAKAAKTLKNFMAPDLSRLLILGFIVMIIAHFTLSPSLDNFLRILSLGNELFSKLLQGQGLVAYSHYETFYQLNLLDRIGVFLARFGKDIFSLSLISLAPLAYLKLPLANKLRKFYRSLILPLFLAAVIFLFLLFLRPIVHREFYIYSILPFLGGLSIFYLFCLVPKRFKRSIICLSICAFAVLSCMITYPLQPLVPTVSTIGGGTYYVLDMRMVNTVFDRSLISFVSAYDYRLYVWADDIMATQIYALTNSSFHFLLEGDRSKSNIVLISHTEHSHAIPSGRDALNNEMYLQTCLQQTDILYTNGFSYAFLNSSTTVNEKPG